MEDHKIMQLIYVYDIIFSVYNFVQFSLITFCKSFLHILLQNSSQKIN